MERTSQSIFSSATRCGAAETRRASTAGVTRVHTAARDSGV
jgi:hypothetical protein